MHYDNRSAVLPHHLHVEHERVSAIPLDGIAQIPDEADRWWKRWDSELPISLQRECDQAIQDAMREHSRRRLAILRDSSFGRHSRFRHGADDDTDNDEELD